MSEILKPVDMECRKSVLDASYSLRRRGKKNGFLQFQSHRLILAVKSISGFRRITDPSTVTPTQSRCIH